MNESIFVYDVTVRRKLWLPKGIRPVLQIQVHIKGGHVYLVHSLWKVNTYLDQYDMFNQDTFLDYLKQVKKRLRKEGHPVYR